VFGIISSLVLKCPFIVWICPDKPIFRMLLSTMLRAGANEDPGKNLPKTQA
jgi:hypothetical protein